MGNIPGRKNIVGKDPISEENNFTGSTREGGRGQSQDSLSQDQEVRRNPAGASFFGDSGGKNEDCQNKPEIKASTKPTL